MRGRTRLRRGVQEHGRLGTTRVGEAPWWDAVARARGAPGAPGASSTPTSWSSGPGSAARWPAYREAEAGRSVVLLERGKPYPPGSFARTPAAMGRNFWDPSEGLHGLFDVWTFRGLEGVVSSGLGGGSLIYANVLLRKDEKWFVHESPVPGGGYENWPLTRSDLDPHYDRVEAMLGATPYPYPDDPQDRGDARQRGPAGARLAAAAARRDVRERPAAMRPVPGAPIPTPTFGNVHGRPRTTCRLCGECDIGCNDGAKNTLDHTYLSAAAHHGADMRTRCEVRGLRAAARRRLRGPVRRARPGRRGPQDEDERQAAAPHHLRPAGARRGNVRLELPAAAQPRRVPRAEPDAGHPVLRER